MHIHWLSLLLALALLLPPIPFSPEMRKTLRRRYVTNVLAALRLWQNWVDLARAALGVYVLANWAIDVPDPTQSGGESVALLTKTAVLGLLLLAQTIRVFRTVQFLAPVFYLSGLTCFFGGWPPEAGPFAVGVGWLFAAGGRNLSYQLPAMAVAVVAAGYVLGPLEPLVMNCGLILVPLVLSVLFKKRLLFASCLPVEA
jgi:hypothetical protein